jgi:hypothetical protein
MLRKLAAMVAPPLLLLAACAEEGDPGALEVKTGDAAVAALRSAPESVADAGTAAFQVVMEIAVEGETYDVVADGTIDADAEQMAMTMDMGALFEELAASSGEQVPEDFAVAWQMVVDGTTFYMRTPLFQSLGVEGWLSMDPAELGMSERTLGLSAASFDFTQMLDSLRGVVGEPEVVGEEDVRGVPTTHYTASMDLEEALAQVPEEERAAAEAQLEQLGDIGGAEIPIDVWIDADDLPRRVRMDVDGVFASLGIGEGGASITMEYFDFGEPVDIDVPSSDEATPITEVLGGGGFGAPS